MTERIMTIPATASSTSIAELTRSPMLDALLEQLPVGILVAGRDGQIEYVNAIGCALLDERRRTDEIVDLGSTPLATDTLRPDPLNWIIARALLTGEIIREEEVECLGAHDEWRTLSVSATPIRDANG